jgi:hypothetical protein
MYFDIWELQRMPKEWFLFIFRVIIDQLRAELLSKRDLVNKGEPSPPLLVNYPLCASFSFSCLAKRSLYKLLYFKVIFSSSLPRCFLLYEFIALLFFVRFSSSALCFYLRCNRARLILSSRFIIHLSFSAFYSSAICCCTKWACA